MQQLSPIDAAFVLLEQPRTPYHVTMVNIYDPSTCPGAPPSFEDICEAIRSSLPAAPSLRRKIVRVPLDLDYPYWVEDDRFDLDFHMRNIALPKPGSWKQFRTQVARLVERPLDLTRPPWEMTIIEGLDGIEDLPSGCFATVLKVHHSAIDGVAGVELVTAINQPSPDQKPRKLKDRWKPEPTPGRNALLQRAGFHAVTRPVAIARLLLANATALAKAAVDLPRSDDEDLVVPKTLLNGPVTARRIWDEVRCPLADLKRVRRAVEGATINDVCLTIVADAMRRYLVTKNDLPKEPLVTAVPISTRTPEQARAGGNQISLMRASLHTDIADPLKRLAAIARETRAKKAVQNGVVMPVLLDVVRNLPGALVGVAVRALPLAGTPALVNTMVTNVPGPLEPYYLLGARAVRVSGSMPLMDGGGLLHAVCSYCGDFVFVFTACPDLLPDPALYRECLEAAVREVVASAGA